MPRPLSMTTWPTPAGKTEKQRHSQTKKILTRAVGFLKKHERVATPSQLAAGIGVSVGELRDESQRWVDTDARWQRIASLLRCRLHDFMLAEGESESHGVRRAAVDLIKIELSEKQMAADNQLTVEGSGFVVNVITFGDKKKNPAKPPGE